MAKILVVDDEECARRFLLIALRNQHQVLEARHGKEAVEIARREFPDLIFMDIMMPVMDGETAARILKEDPRTRGIEIVALSAKAPTPDAKVLFDRYLTKPTRLIDILGIANSCHASVAA